jgi:hypothetical protein
MRRSVAFPFGWPKLGTKAQLAISRCWRRRPGAGGVLARRAAKLTRAVRSGRGTRAIRAAGRPIGGWCAAGGGRENDLTMPAVLARSGQDQRTREVSRWCGLVLEPVVLGVWWCCELEWVTESPHRRTRKWSDGLLFNLDHYGLGWTGRRRHLTSVCSPPCHEGAASLFLLVSPPTSDRGRYSCLMLLPVSSFRGGSFVCVSRCHLLA